ncbi:hypothetical protein M0812_22057 [Anaeramoeba flamelloides]|uniref:Uncharacterized protein n=1 Tax=Anaeramoeba flamelloides TaxID=1746091 RepID=A0AAV7YWM6_9EUKA|nr:hypothetical protein M0812_22057 [Anaeramoeba flamelloides]
MEKENNYKNQINKQKNFKSKLPNYQIFTTYTPRSFKEFFSSVCGAYENFKKDCSPKIKPFLKYAENYLLFHLFLFSPILLFLDRNLCHFIDLFQNGCKCIINKPRVGEGEGEAEGEGETTEKGKTKEVIPSESDKKTECSCNGAKINCCFVKKYIYSPLNRIVQDSIEHRNNRNEENNNSDPTEKKLLEITDKIQEVILSHDQENTDQKKEKDPLNKKNDNSKDSLKIKTNSNCCCCNKLCCCNCLPTKNSRSLLKLILLLIFVVFLRKIFSAIFKLKSKKRRRMKRRRRRRCGFGKFHLKYFCYFQIIRFIFMKLRKK